MELFQPERNGIPSPPQTVARLGLLLDGIAAKDFVVEAGASERLSFRKDDRPSDDSDRVVELSSGDWGTAWPRAKVETEAEDLSWA